MFRDFHDCQCDECRSDRSFGRSLERFRDIMAEELRLMQRRIARSFVEELKVMPEPAFECFYLPLTQTRPPLALVQVCTRPQHCGKMDYG